MKLKISLLTLFVVLFSFKGEAQLNFTVAFDGGYVLAPNNNQMLKNFNNVNSETVTDQFKSLKFMTGLELGFRYNVDFSAFTFGYSTMRRKRTANQIIEDDVLGTELNYSMGTYYLGVETGSSRVRLGTSIGRRSVKIKSTIGVTNDLEQIVKEANWISKFYMTFAARGNDISSIAIRPYFDFAWGGTNIRDAYDRLLNQAPNVRDNFHVIGLSIIFYNGPQNSRL